MTGKTAPEALQHAFEMVEACAAKGERCPPNDTVGAGLLPKLAHAGRIRVEVYPHNFRVVTILEGPRKGARTAEPPARKDGRKPRPHVVIDEGGTRNVNGVGVRPTRAQVSLAQIRGAD